MVDIDHCGLAFNQDRPRHEGGARSHGKLRQPPRPTMQRAPAGLGVVRLTARRMRGVGRQSDGIILEIVGSADAE